MLPKSVDQRFVTPLRDPSAQSKLVYRPAVLGECRLHYSRTTYKVDTRREASFTAALYDEEINAVWDNSEAIEESLHYERRPDESAVFGELPALYKKAKSYTTLASKMKAYLYRPQKAVIWKCAELKKYSDSCG